ncbi:MAG: HTH domain-containing protein [Bacteroidota bacterium]|nr:HTH domain-containing protein [Bacteroidota bacterium]
MQLRQLKIKIDKSTSLAQLNYDDIDSLNLDYRTEQAVKHIKAIHHGNLGNIAFCYSQFIQRKTHFRNLEELTPKKIKRKIFKDSLHISQSTISGVTKSTKTAFSNACIILDIDYYKVDSVKLYTAKGFYDYLVNFVLEDFPIKPHYAVDSGNGIYLVYLLEQLPVSYHFKGNVKFRSLIIKELGKCLKKYGLDTTDLTKYTKVPGSRNYKNDKIVKIINYENIDWNNFKRYDLREMANILNVKRKKNKKITKKKQSKVRYFFTLYSLNITRYQDIERLIKNRVNQNTIGTREMSLFLYGLHFMKAHDDLIKLEEKLFQLNQEFKYPLREREIDVFILKHIEKYATKYDYTNELIISELDIMEVEMKNLKTIISKDIYKKRERKRKRRARRNKSGLTPKQQEKQNRLKKVAKLLEKNMTQKEIGKQLNVSRSTIKRDVKEIKKITQGNN